MDGACPVESHKLVFSIYIDVALLISFLIHDLGEGGFGEGIILIYKWFEFG